MRGEGGVLVALVGVLLRRLLAPRDRLQPPVARLGAVVDLVVATLELLLWPTRSRVDGLFARRRRVRLRRVDGGGVLERLSPNVNQLTHPSLHHCLLS